MRKTVAQLYRMLHAKISEKWYSAALWENGFIDVVNEWLHYIYSYKWHLKNWQMRSIALVSDWNQWWFKWVSEFPIVQVSNFFVWNKEDITSELKSAFTNSSWFLDVSWIDLNVIKIYDPKEMTQIWPASLLRPWTYKISWWEESFGWTFGNKIRWITPRQECCDCSDTSQIYCTYVAWFNELTRSNQQIPLPHPYIYPLLNYCVWVIISKFIAYRSNDDSFFLQLCNNQLDYLNLFQYNYPGYIKVN